MEQWCNLGFSALRLLPIIWFLNKTIQYIAVNQYNSNCYFITGLNIVNKACKLPSFKKKKWCLRRNHVSLEEAIDFVLNSNNCDCDTSIGGLPSDKEDDLDCQLENNVICESGGKKSGKMWQCVSHGQIHRHFFISIFFLVVKMRG